MHAVCQSDAYFEGKIEVVRLPVVSIFFRGLGFALINFSSNVSNFCFSTFMLQ